MLLPRWLPQSNPELPGGQCKISRQIALAAASLIRTYVDIWIFIKDIHESIQRQLEVIFGKGRFVPKQCADCILGRHAFGELAKFLLQLVQFVDTIKVDESIKRP